MLRGLWFLLQLALTLFLGLLVFLAIGIMTDNPGDGVKQGLGYFIILLSVSGIPVIWYGGAASQKTPSGTIIRVLRFVAWSTFSLMILLVLLMTIATDIKFLWAVIPFVAVLVILTKTGRAAASPAAALVPSRIVDTPAAPDDIALLHKEEAVTKFSEAPLLDETFSAVASVLLTMFAGSIYYAWKFVGYIGSPVWFFVAGVLGFAMACVFVFGAFQRLASQKNVQALHIGRFLMRKKEIIATGCVCFFLAWPAFYSFGAIATSIIGQPHKAVYDYRQTADGRAVLVDTMSFFSQLPLPPVFLKNLPKEGRASFSGKKSWFGVTLSEIEPAF